MKKVKITLLLLVAAVVATYAQIPFKGGLPSKKLDKQTIQKFESLNAKKNHSPII